MNFRNHTTWRVIKITGIVLSGLLLAMVAGSLSFSLLRGALHLNFSQEYRKVDSVEKIIFREHWYNKIYTRTFWGLCSVGQAGKENDRLTDVETAEYEEAKMTWPDADVYDVSESRDDAVWYDRSEKKIFVGNLAGESTDSFDTQYPVTQLVFSPDGKYVLYCEIEYGVNGGYSTDEEYCYYRVIELETRAMYTVYDGYREWFEVYWE